MKRITWSILSLTLVLLAGCVVTSVYPYYTAKDLTFDPTLLGTWSDPAKTEADRETWTFEKIANQGYKLSVRDGSETNEFDAHLFGLSGQKFLDCLPRQRVAYHTPAHVLLRVKSLPPQLELQLLDYGWLTELVAANPKAIRHVIVPSEAGSDDKDGEVVTLTADTAELQKFLRRHLTNTNAWVEPIVLKKQ